MRSAVVSLVCLLAACSSPSTPKSQPKAEPAAKAPAAAAQPAQNAVVIDHEVETIDGKKVALSDYRGKALLVVNSASQCGFTPQYADLQKIYDEYKAQGFEVLAFPSNDFGGQEPGSHEEIASFVKDEYSVSFPMFAKVKTKGAEQAPLYKTLTKETNKEFRGDVKWNFTKFLVDPKGHVVARFESGTSPSSPEVRTAIESVLPAAG